jgi:hypothetical protein
MDERKEWIGARIDWRIHVEDVIGADLAFGGKIDTAEEIGDGIVRMSGALCDGGRFVVVTDHVGLRRSIPEGGE